MTPTILSQRQVDLLAFWGGVLPELQRRVPLFGSVAPAPYPFITKSSRGITYRLNVKLDNTSVWLQLRLGSVAETEAAYRRLLIHQEAIRRAAIEEIGFDERPAGEWDSLLVWIWGSRHHGLTDRERWPETQARLVTTTVSLIDATIPFLPPSKWSATPADPAR